jgi:2-keto-4-pentenoate hydratase/2-oxohepta-3-ene-1,7-dioic acid hydratase in catechol pathway
MRFVNSGGRLGLERAGKVIDVAERSGGRFSADPMDAFAGPEGHWDALCSWAKDQEPEAGDPRLDPTRLGPPVPKPTQVFAIGLNYRDHAEEASLPIPASPMVFTKFPSCLVGPTAPIPLTSNRVDWEVELVVVMGRRASRVPASKAFEFIAGYTAGQDISDRAMQFKDKPPQFSLGKSAAGFGPIGPALVTLDEFEDVNDLAMRCYVGDDLMQDSATSNLIFSVAELIEGISRYCVLSPGDLIFTGTPAGVGSTQDPRRYLVAGETIRTEIEGIGELSNLCVAEAEDEVGAIG